MEDEKLERRKKLHKELWVWLSKNPDKSKIDWPGWKKLREEEFHYGIALCFACDTAHDFLQKFCKDFSQEDLLRISRPNEQSYFKFLNCVLCPIGGCWDEYSKWDSLNIRFRSEAPDEGHETLKILALDLANKPFLSYDDVLKEITFKKKKK